MGIGTSAVCVAGVAIVMLIREDWKEAAKWGGAAILLGLAWLVTSPVVIVK